MSSVASPSYLWCMYGFCMHRFNQTGTENIRRKSAPVLNKYSENFLIVILCTAELRELVIAFTLY